MALGSKNFRVDWGEGGKGRGAKLERETVSRVLRYFVPYRATTGMVVLVITVLAVLAVLFPYMIKVIVDDAIPNQNFGTLNLLIFGMVAVTAVQAGLGMWQTWLTTKIGQSVMFDIRNEMYRHVCSMPMSFFTGTKTGEIMSRLNNDVNGVQQVVTNTFSLSLHNVLNSVITIIAMFLLDWRLALMSLCFLPVFLYPTLVVAKKQVQVKRGTQKKLGELSSTMQETVSVSGMLLMKTFSRQEYEFDRFRKVNIDLMKLQIRDAMNARWFFISVFTITQLAPAALYWFGGRLVIGEAMTLGTVIAFTALLGRLYQPVSALGNVHIDLVGSVALFERLFEYLDMPVGIQEKPDAVELKTCRGKVSFENVSFYYNSDRDVLKNVSFVIEPGQMVAVVGASGSGKTTISNLIPRLYDPTSGRITLDGHDLRDVKLQTLGEQIGMVTQETYLFHTTIRENLCYGYLEATDEEIVAAAKAANIHEFIMSLPDGYETVVGERGHKLSGGEKQRMAIARVMLKEPTVLILDEATSSLDYHSEAMIQEALDKLIRSRELSTLVIAHRLSTILAADQILVLDEGRVVEKGTHEELLACGGVYAGLYQKQFGTDERTAQPVT